MLEGGARAAAAAAAPAAASSIPTATALADSLEPNESGVVKLPRSKLPWLLLGGLVLAAGAVTGYMLLKAKGKPEAPAYQPHFALEGVAIVAGETFGKRLVETDGSVTPKELEQAFDAALAELRAYQPAGGSALEIPALVFDEIVAVPRSAFCNPKLYEAYPKNKPADCKTSGGSITLDTNGSRLMVIVGERPRLAASMRDALVQVVCRFQSDDAFSTAVCTRAEEWAKAQK